MTTPVDQATLPLKRNVAFLVLWSSQLVSALGDQTMLVAAPLLVLALTGSAAQAGITGAFAVIPNLILGLPAGALIDRWNRKAIMLGADAICFLAMGSIPLAYALDRLSLAQLYAVALVTGTATIFFDNAEVAALPHVVAPGQLAQATALNETGGWLAAVVGPGLGGLIIGLARSTVAGAALAYLVNGVSFLASVLSLACIPVPFQTERRPAPWREVWGEIVAGLRFLWWHRSIRNLTFLASVQMLLGGPATLAIIVLARNELRTGASTIGLIFSALSVAGLAGSFVAPWLIARLPAGYIIVGAVAIQALATPLLAAAQSPVMLIAGGSILVAVGPAYAASQQAYRLAETPDAMQGRLNSAYWLLVSGTAPLTLAGSGILLSTVGPRAVLYLIGGAVGLAAIVAGVVGIPQLRITDHPAAGMPCRGNGH